MTATVAAKLISEDVILTLAKKVKSNTDLVLHDYGTVADRIFLIGSCARGVPGKDVDFLVQLKGRFMVPSWKDIQWIHRLLPANVHVIFGTEQAQKSLREKRGVAYSYRELKGL